MNEPTLSDIRQSALNLLARREHSALELKNKLLLREFPGAQIEAILEELKTKNLQSDERFAGSFVRAKCSQGYGPLRIKEALKEKGLSSDLIAVFVAESEIDWRQLAAEVKQKKFGETVATEYKEKAKQMRFLQYRGFAHEQIDFAISFCRYSAD